MFPFGWLLPVGVLGVAVVSWMFSTEILKVEHSLGPFGTEIERVEVRDRDGLKGPGDVVAFESNPDSERNGVFGLDFESGGDAVAREVLKADADEVSRRVTEIEGDLDEGAKVAFDPNVWETNPLKARGIPFREFDYHSELGPMPSWRIDGRGDTWAIFVHGMNATRRAGLRILDPLHEAGLPTLLISYRNDPGAPPSEDHLLHLGATEWKDLDAAARYALEHGAKRLIVIGASMGGAIVSQFIHESPRASRVSALIFDAPVLDWSATIDFAASQRDLPGFLATTTEWAVSSRIDFDWDAFDQIARAREFTMPILIFHGTDDTVVPISTSEEFAAALPELVTFYPVPDAEHVESWNVDPPLFDSRVRAFLSAGLGRG